MPVQRSEPAPTWTGRKKLWASLALIVLCGGVYKGISAWRDSHAFLINTTESLPNWAFIIEKNKWPARGDYVFFEAPKTDLVLSHFGEKNRLFGKIVYGLPGDLVEHRGRQVYVNGRKVSETKPFARSGEALVEGPTGRIPERCYYVGTPHKDGLDSRYAAIGYACSKAILGTGRAVL